ncbi:MAG TPA: hypothetical protein VFZ53_06850, partial [Polyangiaceae bacterium]
MASRNWDDLPGIRKRKSLAPPAPPPSEAPPAPTTHELFDVDSAEVEHAREAVARRVAERASARPHPPKRGTTPEPPKVSGELLAPRLSTPLSWQAATSRKRSESEKPKLADAIEEEISDEFLEPVADSVPLALPPISSSEPLASVMPTSALVVQPAAPPRPKRWKTAGAVALAAVAVASIAWFASANHGAAAREPAAAADTPGEIAPPLAAPAIEANPSLRV